MIQKQKDQKTYPVQGPRTSKTIPYSGARTYIAHIWDYPLPRQRPCAPYHYNNIGQRWPVLAVPKKNGAENKKSCPHPPPPPAKKLPKTKSRAKKKPVVPKKSRAEKKKFVQRKLTS